MELMREHLDMEYDAKRDLERQLSKALADVNVWKTRYETEGLARIEEIERDKGKVRVSGVIVCVDSESQKVLCFVRLRPGWPRPRRPSQLFTRSCLRSRRTRSS